MTTIEERFTINFTRIKITNVDCLGHDIRGLVTPLSDFIEIFLACGSPTEAKVPHCKEARGERSGDGDSNRRKVECILQTHDFSHSCLRLAVLLLNAGVLNRHQ